MHLPKTSSQLGAIPLLILVFLASVVLFIVITAIFSFQKEPFQQIYDKKESAAVFDPIAEASKKSYEIHGKIHTNWNATALNYGFDAAKKTGKSAIRLFVPMHEVAPSQGNYDWSGTNALWNKANERGLAVIFVVDGTAGWIASGSTIGPIDADKYDEYETYVTALVNNYSPAGGRPVYYWEAWNEADLPNSYAGTTTQYALTLKSLFSAIKAARPTDTGVVGPGPGGANQFQAGSWLDTVMNYTYTDGTKGKSKLDIVNAHIRGTIANLASETAAARSYYDSIGKSTSPLWVTEHGYPSSYNCGQTPCQLDPNFRGTDTASGEQAQANYYKVSLSTILNNGATKIFTSLMNRPKDEALCLNDSSRLCSEGLTTFDWKEGPYGSGNKPSMNIYQNMVNNSWFEVGTPFQVPPFWTKVISGGTGGIVEVSTSPVYEGLQSLSIKDNTSGSNYTTAQQTLMQTVNQGDTYQVCARVRADAPTNNEFRILVQKVISPYTIFGSVYKINDANTTWKQYCFSANISSGGNDQSLTLSLENFRNTYVRFDDVGIVRTNPPL